MDGQRERRSAKRELFPEISPSENFSRFPLLKTINFCCHLAIGPLRWRYLSQLWQRFKAPLRCFSLMLIDVHRQGPLTITCHIASACQRRCICHRLQLAVLSACIRCTSLIADQTESQPFWSRRSDSIRACVRRSVGPSVRHTFVRHTIIKFKRGLGGKNVIEMTPP